MIHTRRAFSKLSPTLNRNPIAHYERIHLQRSETTRQKRLMWLFLLPLIVGIAIQIAAAFLVPIAQLTGISRFALRPFFDQTFSLATDLAIITLLMQNLMIASAAIRLASTTIAREKQGRTWESLIVTTLSAWRIVTGKWWGVISTLWSQYGWTLVARGIIGGWLILSAELTGSAPRSATDLLLPAALAIIPIINAAYATALGILASCFIGSEAAAARISRIIQAGLFFGVLGFACLILTFLFAPDADPSSFFLPAIAVIVTTLDGGLISLMALTGSPGDVSDAMDYFTGIGIWLVIFVALTWLMLNITRRVVIRQGALRR